MNAGTDIIEIERIKKAIKSPRFLNRVFTQREREYISANGSPRRRRRDILRQGSGVGPLGSGLSGNGFPT